MLTGRVPYERDQPPEDVGSRERARAALCELNPRFRPPWTPWSRARWRRIPTTASPRPRPRPGGAGGRHRAPTQLAEQSVAIGAAATVPPTRSPPTRPAGPDARPATPAAAARHPPAGRGRGPWRRMAIPLALIAVGGGGAAAAILLAGGDDGGTETGGATTQAERTSSSPAEEPSQGPRRARSRRRARRRPGARRAGSSTAHRRSGTPRSFRRAGLVAARGERADPEPALPDDRDGPRRVRAGHRLHAA